MAAKNEKLLEKRLPEAIIPLQSKDLDFSFDSLTDIEPLGSVSAGNFSSINKAKYATVKDGKKVVIDVIAKDLKQEDELYALVELAILKGLQSSYIVEFIGAGRNPESGYPVLVTEYLTRGTVKMALEEDLKFFDATDLHANELTFRWKQRFVVAKHILFALEFLHSHLIIHRDIKSENCFLKGLGRRMQCKLGDFGFARGIAEGRRAMTICGTDALMAPEMISNLPYGLDADMYSYGCLLVELICGKAPGEQEFLPRTRENAFDIDTREVKESALPGCPTSLILLAEHCLEYEVEARISASDAKQWLIELEGELQKQVAERVPSSRALSQGSKKGDKHHSNVSDASGTASRFKRMTIRLRGKTKLKTKKENEGSTNDI